MLLFSTGTVLAGGGDWKMGPFGPYWDDNDWPEFTPMYWMEEFLNRLDDDDDEIQDWMRLQQYQQPGSNTFRPNSFKPGFGPFPGRAFPSSTPFSSPLGSEFNQVFNHPRNRDPFKKVWQDPRRRSMLNEAGVPHLTGYDYARMPKDYQRAYRNVMRDVYLANTVRQSRHYGPVRDYGPGSDYRPNRRRTYSPRTRAQKSLCLIE